MSSFTGTGRLIRLALRRDRIQLPIWLLVVASLPASAANNLPKTYPLEADRISAAKTIGNSPGLLMMRGSVPDPSYGGLASAQTLTFVAVLAGLMSTLAIVRHTRQSEENGRAELIGAGVVGRYAQLTAALSVVVIANLLLCVLTAAFMGGAKVDSTGAFTVGLAAAGAGLVFGGVAAITAQLFESARSANGAAAAFIGLAFLLRGIGDAIGEVRDGGLTVIPAWPSWLSPIGWAQRMEPFGANNSALFGLFLVVFVATVAVAFGLAQRRDVGLGLIAARPAPAAAAPGLLSPEGLAWRLQRGVLTAWGVAAVIIGITVGSLGKQIQDALQDNPDLGDTISKMGGTGGDMVDVFFAAMLGVIGALSAGYAVQVLLRLRAEENGPLEGLLSTSLSRPRWVLSHTLCAVLGTVVILLLAGLGMGLTYGLIIGDVGGQVGTLIGAALVRVPATLVLAGFVVLVFGLLPRLTAALGWGALGLCLLLGQLGELLNVPQSVRDISPFSHVPALPATDFSAGPVIALLAVAAALVAGGVALFRRRDLVS